MNKLAIIFLFASSIALGQEANIIFNRLNMGVYNPAFTGTEGSYASLNSRNQWTGIDDAPVTNYLIYYLPQRKKVNLGFTLQNDRVFIEEKTHFTIDYNYQLQLSETQSLYLGLKAGGFYNNIEVDRLDRLTTVYNPLLEPIASYFTPILGIGIQYKTPSYFLGVGIPSLFENKRFQDNGALQTTATDVVYALFSGGATLPMNDKININPVFVYRTLPNSPNLFSATLEVEYKREITLGGGFSNNNSLAFFVSTKKIRGMEWGYGYEFMNRGDNTAIQQGTHEILLRFILNKKQKEETQRKEGYGNRG